MFGMKLYKLDSNQNIRVWFLEYDEEKYRTHSGVLDGKIVISGWKYPEEKNVGKSNGTSVEKQVLAEVESIYVNQEYQGGYHRTIEGTKDGMKFFKPMLAQKLQDVPITYPVYSSPKLDGIRAIITSNSITSRQGKPILSVPHLLENLSGFFEEFPDVILDGEIYSHRLSDNFEKLISLARKTKPTSQDLLDSKECLEFHCYDVCLPNQYETRYEFLTNNLKDKYESVVAVSAELVNNVLELETKLAEYLEDGYEGQMIRTLLGGYENKRSKTLLKNKEFEDAEFEIVEVLEGVGNWKNYAKAVVIRLEDGTTQQSGMKGTFELAKELLETKDSLIGTQVTVRFQNRTSDNKLRFPVVQTFWKGKRNL